MSQKGYIEEVCAFDSGENTLEGVLAYPETGDPETAVLMIPPHPQMGGRMDNNVIQHLARRLAEAGCITLRFNYHGIGNSTVTLPNGVSLFQHWSVMESLQDYTILREDARHALSYLRATCPGRQIVLAGYSLGAILTGQLLAEEDLHGGIAIAPPNAKAEVTGFEGSAAAKVVVSGDADFAFDAETFAAYFGTWTAPKQWLKMDGADHFFRLREEELYELIAPLVLNGMRQS